MLKLDMFGDDAVFEHIGLAVVSIRDVLGEKAEVITDNRQKVSVSVVEINGIKVELVEACRDDSPVALNLKKGQKLIHLCFRVPNMDRAMEKGRENGFYCIAKPVPATAFNNNRIAWLFSRTYGLFELVEK